jgi:hypothetical protein
MIRKPDDGVLKGTGRGRNFPTLQKFKAAEKQGEYPERVIAMRRWITGKLGENLAQKRL